MTINNSNYALHAERRTGIYRFNPVEQIADYHRALGTEFPVSGDMLTVLKLGSPTQRRRRRARARTAE